MYYITLSQCKKIVFSGICVVICILLNALQNITLRGVHRFHQNNYDGFLKAVHVRSLEPVKCYTTCKEELRMQIELRWLIS